MKYRKLKLTLSLIFEILKNYINIHVLNILIVLVKKSHHNNPNTNSNSRI